MEQEKGLSFRLAIWYTCPSHSTLCAKLGLDIGCECNVRSKSRSSVVNDSKHENRFGRKRGLALGLNEFAGYVSVAIVGFLTGYIAAAYGLKPYPFYLGIAFSLLAIANSILSSAYSEFYLNLLFQCLRGIDRSINNKRVKDKQLVGGKLNFLQVSY